MNDLISRQAVVNVICDMHIGGKDGVANALPNTYGADIREIIEQIDSLPSLDAVEVVRCKNCKNSYVFEPWEGINATRYCKIFKNHYGDSDFCVNDDDFCSYGERKDG